MAGSIMVINSAIIATVIAMDAPSEALFHEPHLKVALHFDTRRVQQVLQMLDLQLEFLELRRGVLVAGLGGVNLRAQIR